MFIEALDLELTPLVAGVAAALAVVSYFVYYVISAGVFYKPVIRTGSPPFEIVCIGYKFYQGTYSQDAKNAFGDLAKICRKQSLNFLGIYYDNPKLVSHQLEPVESLLGFSLLAFFAGLLGGKWEATVLGRCGAQQRSGCGRGPSEEVHRERLQDNLDNGD